MTVPRNREQDGRDEDWGEVDEQGLRSEVPFQDVVERPRNTVQKWKRNEPEPSTADQEPRHDEKDSQHASYLRSRARQASGARSMRRTEYTISSNDRSGDSNMAS